jgi:hypothetical protein
MTTTAANRRRAQDARLTLSHLTIELDGLDTAIIDQLTNLMHLAKHHQIDWDQLTNTAQGHFVAEQATPN